MIRLIFIFSVLINSLNAYGCEQNQKFDEFKRHHNDDFFGPYTIEQMEAEALKKQKEIYEYIKQVSKNNLKNRIHDGFDRQSSWNGLKREHTKGDTYYSIYHEYGTKIQGGVILVRNGCVIRKILTFQGSLKSGDKIQTDKRSISDYFYTVLKVLVVIVCIWVVLGPRREKNIKVTKKDAERLIVEQITRRK